MPKAPTRYRNVGIVYHPEKERAYAEFQRLKRWLTQRGVKSVGSTRVTPAMYKAQLIVVLGGDGTVLGAARDIAPYHVPVLGVNVGRLGFLAATEFQAMMRTMSRVLAGESRVENRMMLSISASIGGKRLAERSALNDCVLRSGATGRVLSLRASIRNRLLANYVGDGLIVATPTGSTAYNLAASGPIVHPDLDVLILSPICSHTLAQRPLVLPTFEVIVVEVVKPGPPALLCVDGQIVRTLNPGDQVEIRRGKDQVQLLMDPDRNFYEVLQNKLKWGGV